MKSFTITLLAAVTLMFSGCSKNEKAAIEDFKTEINSLKTWTESKEKEIATNPMAGMTMINEMGVKMKAVKTSDLPSDLKEAWNDMVAGVDKMTEAMSELPKDPTQMEAFMTKKMQENPKYGQEFQAKMEALGKDMEVRGNKLKEVGKKHGIENLDKIGGKK